MKTLRLVLLLTLSLTPALSVAATPERTGVSSKITSVTVYPDRALTTRSSSFNLKTGSHLITFDNLPVMILDDSVRVTGKGTAAVTITSMETRRHFLDKSGEQKVKELDEEISSLERRLGLLDSKKSGIASQKAFLDSIRVAWGERISKELAIGRPSSAELMDASSFIGGSVTKADEQIYDIEFEKKGIRSRIEALRRQRDSATGSGRNETKSVEVSLEVAKPGSFTLELASITPRASWEPVYDVRLFPDAKNAEMTFRALVRQQTGEEWNNVNLTLSTARPAIGSAPPEMLPWQIGLLRPLPVSQAEMFMASAAPATVRSKSLRIPMESAGADENRAEVETAAHETAQILEDQTSVTFQIPRAVDIPSDGSSHGTVIAIEQLPVEIEHIALPKLSPHVFLKSAITNLSSWPLLPGKINTFVGSSFTGSSQLKKIAAGDKFDLFFGTDDRVTVKREESKQHREAGIFGSNRAAFRYSVQLANFRKEPLTVTLLDQLPLALDAEIKVSLGEPTVKPEQINNNGTIVWKLPLQPGEKKDLDFGIVIEYPKGQEITGL